MSVAVKPFVGPAPGKRRYLVVAAVTLAAALPGGACHAEETGALQDVIASDLYQQAEAAYAEGHRTEASALLDTLVAQRPIRGGAWLDASILYCRLGNLEASRAILETLRREADPPDAIRRVIDLRMADTCSEQFARTGFYAAGSGGWTSNANFAPSITSITLAPGAPFQTLRLAPGAEARGDAFVNLDLFGEAPLPGTDRWSVTGTFNARQYQSVRQFDSALAAAGVGYQRWLGNGLFEGRLNAGQYWLGERPYQHFASLQGGYWFGQQRMWGIPARAGAEVALGEQRYDTNPLYDTRRIELRAKLEFQPADFANALIVAGPAWERPVGDRPGGPRFGYVVSAGLNLQLPGRSALSVIYQHQSLQDSNPYQPVFFADIKRRQTIRQWSVRYTIPAAGRTQVYAQIGRQQVDDSIAIFSYTVLTGSVGMAYSY
ncbi:tetratricopeptide repeat-containing protein [Cupriavidus necator]|uniref:Tetratricopeptide repeat-containing protein n=1 Tax=Cupriavidus necator TaxID=106590 RepID=A0A1U9UUK7_CUPNE|nr:tetratricopeptide repeat protein [Cupriavidus necator]AQV96376.1 tetratricopeptide repeat-containing protein [Cupriavidus necator]